MNQPEIVLPEPTRRIFCNRTLNLRSIRAIGFDMDYTLVHYNTEEWERRAYEHIRERLTQDGWPVSDLNFDANLVSLGLIIDTELGNIVKANRFGYVKQAQHGTTALGFEAQRRVYSRTVIDLSESRWVFINTLFGLSEGCMYAQIVDMHDSEKLGLPHQNYRDLFNKVRSHTDQTHMEGALKAEIINEPERFVELDPELPLALQDLKHAGKRLLLITNSEWHYTSAMMTYAFDRFLPEGQTWRDLFDLMIVQAAKPSFFTSRNPVFEVVDTDSGLLKPVVGKLGKGKIYLGGHAGLVEELFELEGERILYVGDHVFSDVRVSKSLLRWRTALVVRELEQELAALEGYQAQQAQLSHLMEQKERLEHQYSQFRLQLQRHQYGYGPQPAGDTSSIREAIQKVRAEVLELDAQIAPLARAAAELSNARWGLLMRAGNDKSHLARQIERSADIYMSRVSNLAALTPFVYLRSPRGSLPHDSGPSGGVHLR